jgi:hypothetical protein
LETAILGYPDSAFSEEILALKNPNTKASIQTQSASNAFMTVISDNVNVRDLPDPVAGKALSQLSNGTELTVSEETVNASTVEGSTAKWYHITEPLDGWVFGSWLSAD